MVTPLFANLPDKYGRKTWLTLSMTVGIVPVAILAYDRSRAYFYAYYVINMLTSMFCEGSMQCLSLAYVADKVGERRRASAFGVLSGVSAAGFVTGTIGARFLSTSSTFQASATVAVIAAAYMRVFLKDTNDGSAAADEESTRPLCSPPSDEESSPRLPPLRKMPSLKDMVILLRSRALSSRVILNFKQYEALLRSQNSGSHLELIPKYSPRKPKYIDHLIKDQFADLLLIVGVAGAFSQLLLMPILAPRIGERLLNIGLLASCAHIFLCSISWAYWVPYFAAMFVIMSVFIHPCIRSIVSKKAGTNEQGMAQGCITGISSFASIVSPFAFTPLTAWFLSEEAPFDFKGFSIMGAGFGSLIAFVLSITMRPSPPVSGQKLSNPGRVQT